jgi:hypothetical protein
MRIRAEYVMAMDRLRVCGVYGSFGKSQVVVGEERVVVNVGLELVRGAAGWVCILKDQRIFRYDEV